MKVYKITLGILFGFAMISCESNTYDEIGGYVDNPSYEKNIKPIFDSQCTNCHYQGNDTAGGGTEIYDYATTRQSIEFGSALRDIDTTHTMPKSAAALSKAKIKLIYQWKNTDYQP
jgi:hypothetical protein